MPPPRQNPRARVDHRRPGSAGDALPPLLDEAFGITLAGCGQGRERISCTPQGAQPMNIEALRMELRRLMRRHDVPGVAVGVLWNGRTHTLYEGVTSVDHPLPVTADTLFQVGSVTKTITATVIMRLVERGRIDLDAPVRRYVPEFRLADEDTAAAVTIRHLLTHVVGWPGEYGVDTGWGDDAVERFVETMAHLPQRTPLGAAWSYNNGAFIVAARVIEKVTGLPYEGAATTLLLEPLGMRDSLFFPHDVMLRRFTVGHAKRDGEVAVVAPWATERNGNAAGGLCATVLDQLRYARFHLGDGTADDGERILTSASLELMRTPLVATADDGLMERVGLSWMIRDVGGLQVVSHGGMTHGQVSAFWLVPERGFAFTCLSNAYAGYFLGAELTAWVLEHALGVSEAEPRPIAPPGPLTEYEGSYRLLDAPRSILVEASGATLIARVVEADPDPAAPSAPAAPLHLLAYGADRFLIDGAPTIMSPPDTSKMEFLRRPDGTIGWLRYGIFTVYTKGA
jgi:CubicO group peptidase (beta-lactamase class C family)